MFELIINLSLMKFLHKKEIFHFPHFESGVMREIPATINALLTSSSDLNWNKGGQQLDSFDVRVRITSQIRSSLSDDRNHYHLKRWKNDQLQFPHCCKNSQIRYVGKIWYLVVQILLVSSSTDNAGI